MTPNRRRTVTSSRDLDRHGIPREIFRLLCEQRGVQRVEYGLYRLTTGKETGHATLTEVC